VIESVRELEDRLSCPKKSEIDAIFELSGDLAILGVAGKMGPSLARLARRAADEAGVKKRIIGVSRFSDPAVERQLQADGIETIGADLLDPDQVERLPQVENVVFMVGRKFGSTGAEHLTWAMNAWVPALVARRYRESRIVAFSSGNVYPMLPVTSGGATEATPPAPKGDYAQSVLARERLFEYFSATYRTKVCLLRLNYAIDLRYGVLLDLAQKVFERRPVDVGMGAVNVIWQGDANSVCLRSFPHCESPAAVLNLTGPEMLSVRAVAVRLGQLLGVEPVFEGVESDSALLNNAGRCHRLFGYPSVTVEEMLEWTAHWVRTGGSTLNKPTHFETRDGKF
jgi:nucleoside-diphosphate-sugar epimerase